MNLITECSQYWIVQNFFLLCADILCITHQNFTVNFIEKQNTRIGTSSTEPTPYPKRHPVRPSVHNHRSSSRFSNDRSSTVMNPVAESERHSIHLVCWTRFQVGQEMKLIIMHSSTTPVSDSWYQKANSFALQAAVQQSVEFSCSWVKNLGRLGLGCTNVDQNFDIGSNKIRFQCKHTLHQNSSLNNHKLTVSLIWNTDFIASLNIDQIFVQQVTYGMHYNTENVKKIQIKW